MSETKDYMVDYYAKKENCYRDIGEARKLFGSTRTTEAEYNAMEKGLGLMFLYCPKEILVCVEATIAEAEMRKIFYNF